MECIIEEKKILKRLFLIFPLLVFPFTACSSKDTPHVSDNELLRHVYDSHDLPYADRVDFETYKDSVQLRRAEWDLNQDGEEEIVFSVDFSAPDMTYILVLSPQKDSLRELFFSKKFGWYGLNGRFDFQDGYLFLNYLSKGGGSNVRTSDWNQEVVRCAVESCSSFSYIKYFWGFSFGLGGADPITNVSAAKTVFDGDIVTIRRYQYRTASSSVTDWRFDESGAKWGCVRAENVQTLGPTQVTQYRWNGVEFIRILEKDETPPISYTRYAAEQTKFLFRQSLYALHDRWEKGEISEEKIEQDYLGFFGIPPALNHPCGAAFSYSIASAYGDNIGAEVVRKKEGCRLKVWESPDWSKIQNLKEIKAIGTFDFACDADFTRLLWQDINADDVEELFVLTQNSFDETVYIFHAEETLRQLGTFTGFLREPNFRGIEWEWREGRFFLLVGKPFWKDETCRNNLDCYEEIDQPFDAYFWDASARQFTHTCCDIALPANEFAACQDVHEQSLSAAFTMVAQTVTSAAISATPPAPTASATPTMTPTRTPVPTSTTWRVEPVATPIVATYEPLDIFGVDDLPSFGMGKRWKAHPFDNDFDNTPDYFLYTKLTNEQEETWRQSLLEFLKKRGDVPNVDTGGFAVLDTLDIDLDRDGRRETAFAYLLGQTPHLAFGIAVMHDSQILDSKPLDWKGDHVERMRLIGVPISSRQNALLAHLTTVTGGSGIFPYIHRRLLLLEDDKLRIVWDWDYSGGARGGAGFQQYQNEKIRFLNLTSRPEADLLLSRRVEEIALTSDNPANYRNYSLQLPGELVFSWKNGEYRLTHFYQNNKLVSIRPLDFVAHAPKMNIPFRLDGRAADWYQAEYAQNGLNGYGKGLRSRSLDLFDFHVSWDDASFYFYAYADPGSAIWLALDTDLQGDFDSRILNEDDRLFHFQLKNDLQCTLTEFSLIHPEHKTLRALSAPPADPYGNCVVEGKIPLSDLGISLPLVPTPGFALRPQPFDKDYISSTFPAFQYFPAAGKIVGFAMFAENKNNERSDRSLPFDPQDPTTWGTLIFISDR